MLFDELPNATARKMSGTYDDACLPRRRVDDRARHRRGVFERRD
jgi:hypothetical protein